MLTDQYAGHHLGGLGQGLNEREKGLEPILVELPRIHRQLVEQDNAGANQAEKLYQELRARAGARRLGLLSQFQAELAGEPPGDVAL